MAGKKETPESRYYSRQLEIGRKKRTTAPLDDDEWSRAKDYVDLIKAERDENVKLSEGDI
jgi:hypothetical protein